MLPPAKVYFTFLVTIIFGLCNAHSASPLVDLGSRTGDVLAASRKAPKLRAHVNRHRVRHEAQILLSLPDPPGFPSLKSSTSRNITIVWPAPMNNQIPIAYYLIIVQPQTMVTFGPEHGAGWDLPGAAGSLQLPLARRIRTPDNGTTFTVTRLTPFASYTFQLIAVNGRGHSRPGPVSAAYMTESEPPGPPVLIMGQNVSSSSIRLQWLPPTKEKWHGAIRGYRLTYRQSDDGADADHTEIHEIIIENPQIQTYEIRRLQPFQPYYISLQAFNEDGYSDAHTEVVWTAEGIPSMPVGLHAVDITHKTVSLAWLPPATPHGILRSYRLFVTHPAGFTDSVVVPVDGGNGSAHYLLTGLLPHSTYYTQVAAQTSKGQGALTANGLLVVTDIMAPDPPKIVNITRVADNALLLTWISVPWKSQMNAVHFYRIYYGRIHSRGGNVQETVIQVPARKLKGGIWPIVKSKPDIKSDREEQVGENDALYEVVLANLTNDQVYKIRIQAVSRSIIYPQRLLYGPASSPLIFHMLMDPHQASSSSPHPSGEYYVPDVYPELTAAEVGLVVACVVAAGVVLLLCGIYCAFRRRYLLSSYSYLPATPPNGYLISNGNGNGNGYVNPWRRHFPLGKDKGSAHFFPSLHSPIKDKGNIMSGIPLPVADLEKHIKMLYADGQIGLSREYESLATLLTVTAPGQPNIHGSSTFSPSLKEALRPENRPKNRYVNVLAYDNSRVKLKTVRSDPTEADSHGLGEKREHCDDSDLDSGSTNCGCTPAIRSHPNQPSDYINANLIDGMDSPAAYIATQAPMSNTLSDFWAMVWDYNVRVVIMLTNLEENGRRKSEQYWPSALDQSTQYGPFLVSLLTETTTAFYVVRNFTLVHKPSGLLISKLEEERPITQYMYIDWPDHGRPEIAVPLLRFVIKSSRSFQDENVGPPVVHCSAGVGRSGCYVALHALIQQIDRSGMVDVFGFLLNARKQRMGLCQNESQYALVYDALLEYVQSGQTEVYVATFGEYLDGLLKWDMQQLHRQHEMICQNSQPYAFPLSFDHARQSYNQSKNRSLHLIPTDTHSHRVTITPQPAQPGSDYINASFLPSFSHLKQFIITQRPMDTTIVSFWQMIWDHRVESVLCVCPTAAVEESGLLPSSLLPLVFDSFQIVSHMEAGSQQSLSLTKDGEVRDLSCRWITVQMEVPADGSLYELVRDLDNLVESSRTPTVVMDENGGPSAALLCALITIYQQGSKEASVDLYQTARLYQQIRPGLFGEFGDYKKLHDLARDVCRKVAKDMPIQNVFFSLTSDALQITPSSPTSCLSKRLSAILEE